MARKRHLFRWANGGVPDGVWPDGSVQNDSGLPQGPDPSLDGRLMVRRSGAGREYSLSHSSRLNWAGASQVELVGNLPLTPDRWPGSDRTR